MTPTTEELAAQLVRRPFDKAVRQQYVEALESDERWADATEQWALLIEQDGEASKHHLGAARCSLSVGNKIAAHAALRAAKACDDYVADPNLEVALTAPESTPASTPKSAPPPKLRVLSGGADDVSNVVPMVSKKRARFADIVGMEDLKKTIRLRIIEPFLKPGLFAKFKKKAGGGILLYGPPGCGKTLFARAIATECNALFIPVGISDILNRWIGESERNLSLAFERARANRPAVLFFDELDALAFSRSKASTDHTRSLVNEFLGQLDGVERDNDQVLVLAATNLPWDVDAAMKRPGRFDRQLFVPPPDRAARAAMLHQKLVGVPLGAIDLDAIASVTDYCSGADMDGLIELAKETVLEDILTSGRERSLEQTDLIGAAQVMEPSTMDWLRTARNLVKYAGGDRSYKEVERYLKYTRFSG